jgi:hypothetical protein
MAAAHQSIEILCGAPPGRFIKYKWLHKKDYASWSTLKNAILTIIILFGSTYTINFKKLIQNNLPFNSA